MLLDRYDGLLVNCGEMVLRGLPPALASQASAETHEATLELASAPHGTAEGAARDAATLREGLSSELAGYGLVAASAGTHPLAHWTATTVSRGARYALVYESMRELARREPTFGLHVHVGVADPERRDRASESAPRPSAAAPRVVGQLAVLARSRYGTRLGAHADLPGLPARRNSTDVPFLSRVRRSGRSAPAL